MTDQELKLTLLDKSGGDVDKAKAMLAWLTVADANTPPEPAPTVEGIVLTDSEIQSSDAETLLAVAMARLAVKQNNPGLVVADISTKEVSAGDESEAASGR